MLRVGLTGGIGSGKTMVTGLFAARGIAIIDTDHIAHDIVAHGSPLIQQLGQLFGAEVITAGGALDRSRMRQIIFNDAMKRKQLEELMHPLIRTRALEQIAGADSAYCIVVVPLLLEKGWQSLVDRILVVDAPQEMQLARTQQRDGLSTDEVHAIISAQISREQRLAAADDIIVNDADMEKVVLQVEQLHQKYLQLATARIH
ncbi:MAG: dephospho-CoA kinase [Gammaproteobacteria bacterium HGW-Gammaproteobacteria-1]|jgi:dephospho-CoA kinase|nr:MAG: dephospho-CoA kinase [Gammaproteobacteria bacterium HGW-Gammaproteobacteria-1]